MVGYVWSVPVSRVYTISLFENKVDWLNGGKI